MKHTITSISKNTGISKSYVSELASGVHNNPTNRVVVLLATELRIQPAWYKVLKKLGAIQKSHSSGRRLPCKRTGNACPRSIGTVGETKKTNPTAGKT